MTFLLYLNPNWDENKYAETSFYDYADNAGKSPDQGMEMNEAYDFISKILFIFHSSSSSCLFRRLIDLSKNDV